jgi:hypothetical protein
VVMLTHLARERDVRRALEQIAGGDYAARPPHMLRVVR